MIFLAGVLGVFIGVALTLLAGFQITRARAMAALEGDPAFGSNEFDADVGLVVQPAARKAAPAAPPPRLREMFIGVLVAGVSVVVSVAIWRVIAAVLG